MEQAFKMFRKDLTCTLGRGIYQYVPGMWHEEMETEANCVRNGFHAAKNPLDCLSYYSSFADSQCWVVDIDGDVDEDAMDSKVSAQRIRLKGKIELPEFVAHACIYIMDHPEMEYNRLVTCGPATPNRNHFAISIGEEPRAKGNVGDVIAMLKTHSGEREVIEAACFEIDGKEYKAGTWYGADGKEARDDPEE